MIDFSEICCTFAPCMCFDTCNNILERKTLDDTESLSWFKTIYILTKD